MKILLVLFLASNARAISVSGSGSSLSGTDITPNSVIATEFSSAPIVNVSTISSPGSLNIYTNGGTQAAKFTTVGMIGSSGFSNSIQGTLDLIEGAGGDLYLIRNDTTFTAADLIVSVRWRTLDSSTGGTGTKAYIKSYGQGTWGSGQTMESEFRFGLSRGGNTAADYIVTTTSGTLITSGGGFADGTVSACSTCTLQIVSPLDDYGVDVVGELTVSSTTRLGTKVGTQLYRCSGGTFAGNIVYGAAGICTAGTAVATGIYIP